MVWRVRMAILLVIGANVAWGGNWFMHMLGQWPGPGYVDRITGYERRCDSIRTAAQQYRILGHDIGLPIANASKEIFWMNSWRHFAAQYTLAPVIVDYGTNYPVIIDDPYRGPIRLVERHR